MDYAHVNSAFIRSILNGTERNIKAISGAAYATEFAFHDDWRNHSLDETVTAARENAIEAMTDCLVRFDTDGAIDALRAYWSI
jgi:hypothetical protein